jgi:hypothetical protein
LGEVRRVRQHNWTEIRHQMQAELVVPIGDARPLRAMASGFSIPVRSLRAHFPALCRALADRYRSRRKIKTQERDALLMQQMQAAAAALGSRGFVLSKRRVALLLSRPGMFNPRYTRRIYDKMLREISHGPASGPAV